MRENKVSRYLSYILRHHPEELSINIDKHGYVDVSELISAINQKGVYRIGREELAKIVDTDSKGRYRFSMDGSKIKACQGHSIPFVEPELKWTEPPQFLFHGTTMQAYEQIVISGSISKMQRHGVHLQEEIAKALQSAKRWKQATPVILRIDALKMHEDGLLFGISDNHVWCTDHVPTKYIVEVIQVD